MRTTALVVEGPGGDFVPTELEIDGPRDDEVLVRMVATGLCHTDLSLRDTLPAEMFPRVFGHEGAGVVQQVGAAVEGVAEGDHVVLSFASCGSCAACSAGKVGYCSETFMLNYMGMRGDGSTTYSRGSAPVYGSFFGQSSFAQHAVVHHSSCVVVDPALDLTRIAPYGCGFQTGAGAMLNVLAPAAGDSVVVYGVGAVGLAAVAAGRSVGADVIAVDLAESRRTAAARLGARVVDPAALGDQSLVDHLRELTGGGARGAIDTTAVPAVLTEAIKALGPQGTLVVLGLDMTTPEFTVDAVDLLQGGKVVRGSIEGESVPRVAIPQLLELAATGSFDLDPLIATFPFTQVTAAIDAVTRGEVVKPVLIW